MAKLNWYKAGDVSVDPASLQRDTDFLPKDRVRKTEAPLTADEQKQIRKRAENLALLQKQRKQEAAESRARRREIEKLRIEKEKLKEIERKLRLKNFRQNGSDFKKV